MKPVNNPKTILFDLDGTLRHNDPPSDRVFFDQAVRLGLERSEDRRRSALRWTHKYWANSPTLQEDLKSFAGENDLFWQNYTQRHLAAYGCPPDQVEALAPNIFRFMRENYQPEDTVPSHVLPTLRSLQGMGYTLGVVSNRDESFATYLDEVGIRPYIDFSLAAGEVNSYKPDAQIFFFALAEAGAAPGEALYVGDNYYADVVGATAAGIRPVLIDPERIFPEAQCEVIDKLPQLMDLLS